MPSSRPPTSHRDGRSAKSVFKLPHISLTKHLSRVENHVSHGHHTRSTDLQPFSYPTHAYNDRITSSAYALPCWAAKITHRVTTIFTFGRHVTIPTRSPAVTTRYRWATAADLPIEICTLIINIAVDTYWNGGRDREVGLPEYRDALSRDTKRTLSILSLVCSSWTSSCQKEIFRDVFLQSGQDLDSLASLQSGQREVKKYIEELHVEGVDFRSTPWLHKLCRQVQASLDLPDHGGCLTDVSFPNLRDGMRIYLVGSTATVAVKYGLHCGLPRTVPASFSRGIQLLSLVDVDLPSIVHVAKLSAKLPSLQRVELYRAGWEQAPSMEPDLTNLCNLMPRRIASPFQLVVKLSQRKRGSPAWVSTFLACIFSGPPGNRLLPRSLNLRDLEIMCRMVETTANISTVFSMTPSNFHDLGISISTHVKYLKADLCDGARGSEYVLFVLSLKFVV